MSQFQNKKFHAWIFRAWKYEISILENDIFMHENGIYMMKINNLPKISYGMKFPFTKMSIHENDIVMHENGISMMKINVLPKISCGMIFFRFRNCHEKLGSALFHAWNSHPWKFGGKIFISMQGNSLSNFMLRFQCRL